MKHGSHIFHMLRVPTVDWLVEGSRMAEHSLHRLYILRVPFGNISMSQDQLAENLETILKRVESNLDRGSDNIASIWVKTTMGKAVRLG